MVKEECFPGSASRHYGQSPADLLASPEMVSDHTVRFGIYTILLRWSSHQCDVRTGQLYGNSDLFLRNYI